MVTDQLRLCLVTDLSEKPFPVYLDFLLQAIQGGVTSVQLRAKNLVFTDFHERALSLKALLTPLKIPLIINDHVEIAKAVNAEGVHIGQSDGSPQQARELLGSDKLIGISVESLPDLEIANRLDCIDYIAASAVFPTQTKTDCKTYWGLDGLQLLVEKSRHPVIAIGGIQQSNINSIMNCGASGVAIVSAIHDSINPRQAASNIIHAMRGDYHA